MVRGKERQHRIGAMDAETDQAKQAKQAISFRQCASARKGQGVQSRRTLSSRSMASTPGR